MPNEPEANVVEGELTDIVETPPEAAEPEVDYKAELEKLTAKHTELEASYKAQRKNEAKLSQRVATMEGQDAAIARLTEQIASLQENVAHTRDYTEYVATRSMGETNPYGEEKPASIPLPTVEAFNKERAELNTQALQAEAFEKSKRDFFEMMVESELDTNDQELMKNLTKDFTLSPTDTMKQIPKYVRELEKTRLEGEKKVLEEEKLRKDREASIANGELDNPATIAGGGGYKTDQDFINAYGAENSTLNSPADHKRASEIMAKM